MELTQVFFTAFSSILLLFICVCMFVMCIGEYVYESEHMYVMAQIPHYCPCIRR